MKIAFIGAQTGDEGKGVRVAYYVKKAVSKIPSQNSSVWTMRWQGGANAGHTVFCDGLKYALHQVPSGILIDGTYNIMGEGVFLEPRGIVKEIILLREKGVRIDNTNFGISSNAHVTFGYHIEMDSTSSAAMTGHTSTGRGIKPTAVDKYGRVGVRFEEFLNRDSFIEALKHRFPLGMPAQFGTYESFVDSYAEDMKVLAPFSVLQSDILNNSNFKFGFAEGAQGFQLDVDRGLYPGITSSNPSIVPFRANKIIGVVKLYASSVGGGRPFIGRMNEELETSLRDLWNERGTTTGKPRSIGWLDIVALKHAIRSCDIDSLVSTCGDRIQDLTKKGEKMRLIFGYKINGKIFTQWDKSFHRRDVLYNAEPVFEEFDSWDIFFDKEKRELTPKAFAFIERIEELTGKKFAAHGYGPGIDDVLEIEDILSE